MSERSYGLAVVGLEEGAVVGTFSNGVASIPGLAEMLGVSEVRRIRGGTPPDGLSCVVGWGRKPNTREARAYSAAHDLVYVALEDGFVRSVGLGVDGAPPHGITVDDVGVYYDASNPSRLELLLTGGEAGPDPLEDTSLLERADGAIARIRAARISKYNRSSTRPVSLAEPSVLVVDQTAHDMSVECGLVAPSGFDDMLRAALDEHPDARILVKTHPDVSSGVKQSCMSGVDHPRVRLIADDTNPVALAEAVDHVYVATSQLGFEALLVGTPVTCFGAPFYAGWGLTDDRVDVPRRGRTRSLTQVFAAAYLLCSRYLDPDLGRRCELETLLDHLELQRRTFEANRGVLCCVGFQGWKQRHVRPFLSGPDTRLHFVRNARGAARWASEPGARFVVWGHGERPGLRALADRHRVPLWRMEDGFLRSVGLGSDIVAPASLVLDRVGIYYDPTAPSELERLLAEGRFEADELERAAALREAIVRSRLSKYNASPEGELVGPDEPTRRVILVPGQVEDDVSVRLGSPQVRSNEALLRATRSAHPDAYVIYKPHPDVVSGNRRQGRVSPEALAELCDRVEANVSLHRCLDVADEVHTMTSLVGFEALLRGKRVVVHGAPFYAGWGLTEDRIPMPRRTRARSLDELVAATLLRYPRYVHRGSGTFTTPETIVELLAAERGEGGTAMSLTTPWMVRQLRRLGHILRGLTNAS